MDAINALCTWMLLMPGASWMNVVNSLEECC